MYRIEILGQFDVVHADGRRMRPSGKKDCALLALLALAPGHRMSRRAVQGRLWSDRGEPQAAASLRQVILQLRRHFGDAPQVIAADRSDIWIVPGAVTFDHKAPGAGLAAGARLLDGVDLADRSFQAWLIEQRAAWAPAAVLTPADVARRLVFSVAEGADTGPRAAVVGHGLADAMIEAAALTGQRGLIDARLAQPGAVAPTDLRVHTRVIAGDSEGIVTVAVIDAFGTVVWQLRRLIDPRQPGGIRATELEVAQQFQDYLMREEVRRLREGAVRGRAEAYTSTALLGIAVPGRVALGDIEAAARQAVSLNPTGLNHALLGMARVFVHGERMGPRRQDRQELLPPFHEALARDPGNGVVNALAGHAHAYLLGDIGRGLDLTRAAVQLSPGSGLAWSYRALSLSYGRHMGPAMGALRRLTAISANSALQPMADSVGSYVHLLAGQPEVSQRLAARSMEQLPDFRPTAVDLMVSAAQMDAIDAGSRALELLRRRDSDLSIDLLRSPDYP
ncbi:MAG: hypothetical protein AAF631_06485, partial [Pseudomonadota bacterium]